MIPSKNVLQFLCFRSPYGGSFFQSLLNLEQILKNDGIGMIYLFHQDTSDIAWVQDLIGEGKNVYFLTGTFFKDLFIIKDILIKHDIKYVHAHFAGLKYFFLLKLARLFYHQQLFIIRHLRNHDKPRGFVTESLRKALNHVDLYIGCSESVAIEYRKNFRLNADQVTYVTNAIDFTRLDEFEELKRSDLGISAQATVFLMFGFDYIRKGVDVVLEAMDALSKQGQHACLLLSLSVNQEMIEKKIIKRFNGVPAWLKILQPREDIATYYNICDYFISASREEGFCNALVEAAYCQKLIISSDIPGQNSLNIPHTRMFPSADVEALIKEMLILIGLPANQKREITMEQKAYVIKTFDINEWANQILQSYITLAATTNE